jgi:hypothetical protein
MNELRKPITWPEIPRDGQTSGILGWPTLYQDLAVMREDRWTKWCRLYEETPEDFYIAWYWVEHHPVFWYHGRHGPHESTLCSDRGVDEGLEFRPAKVNPKNLKISKTKAKNTLLQIWVEVFPTSMSPGSLNTNRLHDTDCDTGAGTYEEAVIAVAKEIYEHHGNDRVALEQKWKSA